MCKAAVNRVARDTVRIQIHQKRPNAIAVTDVAALGIDDRQARMPPVDDPSLFTVQHPACLCFGRLGFNLCKIAACAGFGQRGAGADLTAQHVWHMALAQRTLGNLAQAQCNVVAVDKRHGKTKVSLCQDAARRGAGAEIQPLPANGLRHLHAQNADLPGHFIKCRIGRRAHRPVTGGGYDLLFREIRNLIQKRLAHFLPCPHLASRSPVTPTIPRGMKIVASTRIRP